jgi:sulfide:quinone oxidoreductase
MKTHYDVLIIGAGTGGIMTASQLKRNNKKIAIAILDPSPTHWYQPAWTLVGAGTYSFEKTKREQKKYIPSGVTWIQDKAVAIFADKNEVATETMGNIEYKVLVLSPGVVMRPEEMPGLTEALQTPFVCSNYIDPEKTLKVMEQTKEGIALFTQPNSPIKCGGAPQKAAYLADAFFRKNGIRNKINVVYATPGSVVFGVKEFAERLTQIIKEREIQLATHYEPIRIDSVRKIVFFKYLNKQCKDTSASENEEEISVHYDMLHIAPPQSPPDFIRNSNLVYAEGPSKGWLEVDIHTLQHKKYKNIFGLGDAAALPTAKTGAAIRKQVPVVVANCLMYLEKQEITNKKYSGYSSCPLVTDYGKMLLAEFKYDNIRDSDPLLSKLVDTRKDSYFMWILKKYLLPWLYWNRMLKGKM